MKQYKTTKRITQVIIGLCLVSLTAGFFIASSSLNADTSIPDEILKPSEIKSVPTLFDRGLEFLEYFLGSIALIALWVSAFQFALAQGIPEKVAKAKRSLIYSLIGIFLAVLSYGITVAVFKMTQ